MSNFYIIGNPVSQSKSPVLFKYIFQKMNINAQYKSKKINSINNLSDFIKTYERLNIQGINITMPLKETICPYIDIFDENAKIIQSINCIHFKNNQLLGYNNDYYGFNKLIDRNQIKINASNNIVLGSGGSARAIILSLIHHKASNIYILSRNVPQINQLIQDISPYAEETKLHIFNDSFLKDECNLINCTPIGMLKMRDTILIKKIPKINYRAIIDINYNIKYDYFNQNAEIKIDGKAMFIYQALKSLDIWFESNISDKLSYQELKKIIC
tara:strand:+ start:363 stop:1175 length:813 start_codon:yes stop_codon:yes gene_type:complete